MEISNESLEKTFTGLIGDLISESNVTIDHNAETYVIKVITNISSGVHNIAPRGAILKDLLRKALDADGLIRREYLRVTGDSALFISGIFPDSLESKRAGFGLSDYIDIGQAAYSNIDSDIFDELAIKFPQMVDILNTLSINIDLTSADLSRYIKRRRIIDAKITRR